MRLWVLGNAAAILVIGFWLIGCGSGAASNAFPPPNPTSSTPSSSSSGSTTAPTSGMPAPSTTLTAETGNNTSAADTFAGTTNDNIAAGNISKVAIRSLLYAGSATKIYANWVPWWGNASHINVGYSSSDPNELKRQVNDMLSRGIDGVIVDWYSATSLDQPTQALKKEVEQHPGFEFALMPDSGAYTGVADPTAKLIADLNYAASMYFASPNYMRLKGKPVVFPFGLESFPIDWNAVLAAVQGGPAFIFRNVSGFTATGSSGAYAWGPDQSSSYADYFYSNALVLNKPTYGFVSKGFNDSLAAWGQNRFLDQQCGQEWLNTFALANKYYSPSQPLSYMQIVTWNDYEEGTAIESGIDNCVSVSAQVSGSTVTWSINGQENTIDHYTVFMSQDGTNLSSLGDIPAGTHTLDLSRFGFQPAAYTLYVKAVGKPSLRNQMSNAVSYRP